MYNDINKAFQAFLSVSGEARLIFNKLNNSYSVSSKLYGYTKTFEVEVAYHIEGEGRIRDVYKKQIDPFLVNQLKAETV